MTAATPTADLRVPDSRRMQRSHLHQLDFMRGSTFLLVILAHVMSNTNDENSAFINELGAFGHFSRNAFFFLTGFVLMYGNYAKTDFSCWTFWRRRLKLVAIPYLIWSVIYWAFTVIENNWSTPSRGLSALPTSLRALVDGLLWGTAGFHLYFLFVIMQFYLLFPLILKIVRATRGHHVRLLVASAALQIGVCVLIDNVRPPVGDWLGDNWWHAYATFLPYQFIVLLGAVVCVHRTRVDEWLRGKGWILALALTASGVLVSLSYRSRLASGRSPIDAGFVLNPALLPFIASAVVSLYAVAVWWSRRRLDGALMSRVVAYASNRSFAIFLSHVFVLQLLILPRPLAPQGWFEQHIPAPWATTCVYVLTVAITLGVSELLRRVPGALYLTGRPRIRS